MRHIREALKLVLHEGKSANQTAVTLGLPPSTLKGCLSRFRASGMPLDVALGLSDEDLSGHLYPQVFRPKKTVAEPDIEALLVELKRPGVTIQLLWEEYRKVHPSGLGKTQFWQRLHDHRGMTNLVMRQDHKPGERVMVDYSGDGLSVTDPVTGEVHKKELFVMAWAMSGLFFAMAQDSQKSVDWSMGHVAAFEYFGCAPSVATPDCLKSAVTKAHRYDPVLNRTYVEMCTHYGVVAVPARPHSPRDKGRVENTVRLVQQRIVAVLRDRIFHSLADLNAAVRIEVDRLNDQPMPGHDDLSRRQIFERYERPAAKELPQESWIWQEWLSRRPGLDYCVEVEKHWYSVPHGLAGKPVDVRVTASAVEIYRDRERVAVHTRSRLRRGHTIQSSHMPESHRKILEQDLVQLTWRAGHIGPNMKALVQMRIDTALHPVQAVRPIIGLVRRAENFADAAAVERAAAFAMQHNRLHCDDFERILKSRAAEEQVVEELGVVVHANLQGQALWSKEK